jgi:hypothetical protein
MKEEMVVRLNTKGSLVTAADPDGAGLYTRFGEESEKYQSRSFRNVIKYCVESNKESELGDSRTLAGEIRTMLMEESPDAPFEIMVYDINKTAKTNVNEPRSNVMHLDDLVGQYTDKRELEGNGELYDYLDMVVQLNSAIGR